MGLQNSNFALTFPHNGGFSAYDFAFLKENFSTRIKFSDSLQFSERETIAPLTPLPPPGTTPLTMG